MRTTLLIERYRKFAARTRLSMALLAFTLFAAIGMLFAIGARASQAGFLDVEARNITNINSADDMALVLSLIHI